MAETTLTPATIVKNTMSADLPIASGTPIVAANTMVVSYPKEGRLLLILNNTFAGAKVFTIKAGADFVVGHGVGDMALSLAQDDVRFLIVSQERFLQADGNVDITFESGTTGFVMAFYLPD